MRQQRPCPEVQVGGHALENITEDVRSGKDASARLPMILFVVRRRGVARGGAGRGRAVLTFAVVALQVVLETGRLGAGIVTMRAAVGFLS